MHKITKSSTTAGILVEIPASRLPKVRDGTELHLEATTEVVPSVHDIESVGGFFFVGELGVDVSYHVIAQIVADVKGFEASEFGEFYVEISVALSFWRHVV